MPEEKPCPDEETCTRCGDHPADPNQSVCWRCAYAIAAN